MRWKRLAVSGKATLGRNSNKYCKLLLEAIFLQGSTSYILNRFSVSANDLEIIGRPQN